MEILKKKKYLFENLTWHAIYLLDQTWSELWFDGFCYWIKPHLLQRAEPVISMATQNFHKKYEPTTTRRLQAKLSKLKLSEKETWNFLFLFINSLSKHNSILTVYQIWRERNNHRLPSCLFYVSEEATNNDCNLTKNTATQQHLKHLLDFDRLIWSVLMMCTHGKSWLQVLLRPDHWWEYWEDKWDHRHHRLLGVHHQQQQ